MGTILFVIVAIYCIFLNLRIREAENEVLDLALDIDELESRVYNKMMDIRKEIKESIKEKKVEKPRRRSTKRRSKVS